MTIDDEQGAVDPLDLELHPRTGEFTSPITELTYRRHVLALNHERFARAALCMATVMLVSTFVDLNALGVGPSWLALLGVRIIAASGVVLVSFGFRRDAERFAAGTGESLLVLVQVGIMAAFIASCAARPSDAVVHAVTGALLTMMFGVFVPGRAVTKRALVVAFQLALLVVAATRFPESTSVVAYGTSLAGVALFSFVARTNFNRSQRAEWRTTLEQLAINARLVEEAQRGERLRAELYREATQDQLTGLANRRSLLSHGEELVELARRRGSEVTAVLMDADAFKQINDLYGHAAGDAVLRAVGDSLRASSRQGELVGRIGGEEFAVVAEGLDDLGASALAERMRTAVRSTSVLVDGFTLGVTVSVGVTRVAPSESLASALGRADRAMYEAKASGGDRVLVGAA